MRPSEQREHIFKLLFMSEFNSPEEMPEQLRLYFDGMEALSPEEQTSMEEKYRLVRENIGTIDGILNETAQGWRTDRMSRVDLAALRLAVYEVLMDEDIPTGVAINEAVEIAKRFGGGESGSFVNGILGRVALRAEKKKEESHG